MVVDPYELSMPQRNYSGLMNQWLTHDGSSKLLKNTAYFMGIRCIALGSHPVVSRKLLIHISQATINRPE